MKGAFGLLLLLPILVGGCAASAPTPVPSACVTYQKMAVIMTKMSTLQQAVQAKDGALIRSLGPSVVLQVKALEPEIASSGLASDRLMSVEAQILQADGYAQLLDATSATEAFAAAGAGMELARNELLRAGFTC